MRTPTLILTLLIILMLITVTGGRREKELHITSLTIQFDKTDALFTVNYDFDKLTRAYILIFGGNIIEPKVKSIFPNIDYDVIKIDQDKAILRVKNISRLNKGYYLHNSQKLGETIDMVYISDHSNTKAREYYNINATPDYFYRQ